MPDYILTTEPSDAKNTIKICASGACKRNFCADTIKAAEKELDIEIGNTTPDGNIELTACGCLGNCSQGPSTMINGKLFGRMFPKEIKKKIQKLKKS
ncbi:MAG: NAD(P)H-dependent oxidoreductase subunit E [Candidatus Peregrinibacteria bacterium]|nr:NAD(P)H-dependent oxidoreductase subunit E [Candidatus Peregrinibacteria bacterium]MDZ4244972.1 NAD(P)H-dependent oxidoreductase subunit E [Candidatus Gracilibacteria bacterium]